MKGWKTLVFGAVIAALGTIDAAGLASVIPEQFAGLAVGAIGVVVMFLRSVTTTSIGQSE